MGKEYCRSHTIHFNRFDTAPGVESGGTQPAKSRTCSELTDPCSDALGEAKNHAEWGDFWIFFWRPQTRIRSRYSCKSARSAN
jgi:hypothetical protein